MEFVQRELKWNSTMLVSHNKSSQLYGLSLLLQHPSNNFFYTTEYVIVVTHREMWQNIGPILSSQADLASFSLEVSKKLGLRYHQPSKPVHLSLDADAKKVEDNVQKPNVDQDELDSIANLFKKDE